MNNQKVKMEIGFQRTETIEKRVDGLPDSHEQSLLPQSNLIKNNIHLSHEKKPPTFHWILVG